jgi:glycosyltransferase involved in cell wall biosynthesis
MSSPGPRVSCLLLVRNGVDHDARVLRAARVAERTLGGRALVVGVASGGRTTGESTVEGVAVRRLRAGLGAFRLRAAAQPAFRAAATPAETRRARGAQLGDAPIGPLATATPAETSAPPHGGPVRLGVRARVGRAFAGASFAWQALRFARRVRPQVVHANDWNTMWCATAIKLTCGAHLVYDSHELWPDRNGRWEWRPWLLAGEALFVRVADAVMTASPGYADVLARRYRIARPLVVRNIPEATACEEAGTDALPISPPLVVYIGGLLPGRGLEQTIDALALAPEARLRLIGPGSEAYRASLLAKASAAGVAERLELTAPVPPSAVARALAGATAGLCLIQPVCRSYELTLPNKLFEYAAAGVPVLASDLPVIGAVVREGEIGEVVAADDPAAIAAAMRRMAEPGRRLHARWCAKRFASTNTWSAEAQRLADAYV